MARGARASLLQWGMLLKGCVLCLAWGLVTPLPVLAGDEAVLTPKQEEVAPRGPDHLNPISEEPFNDANSRYAKQLDSSLNLQEFAFARMLAKPSLAGELTVSIHGAQGERDLAKTENFVVHGFVASATLWFTLPEHKNKLKEQLKITEGTAPLPKDLALRIVKVWEIMLDRTDQPVGDKGLDGATYEFSAQGKKPAQTWSPDSHLSPGILVDLGYELIDLSSCSGEKRAAATARVKSDLERLEKYLEAHPRK